MGSARGPFAPRRRGFRVTGRRIYAGGRRGRRVVRRHNGEVAKWSKALAWRASRRHKRLVGSNPTLSAKRFANRACRAAVGNYAAASTERERSQVHVAWGLLHQRSAGACPPPGRGTRNLVGLMLLRRRLQIYATGAQVTNLRYRRLQTYATAGYKPTLPEVCGGLCWALCSRECVAPSPRPSPQGEGVFGAVRGERERGHG